MLHNAWILHVTQVISSLTLLCIWLLIQAGIKSSPFFERGLWWHIYAPVKWVIIVLGNINSYDIIWTDAIPKEHISKNKIQTFSFNIPWDLFIASTHTLKYHQHSYEQLRDVSSTPYLCKNKDDWYNFTNNMKKDFYFKVILPW